MTSPFRLLMDLWPQTRLNAPASLPERGYVGLGAFELDPRHARPPERPQQQLGRRADHGDHGGARPNRQPDGLLPARPLGEIVPGELDADGNLTQHQPGPGQPVPDLVGEPLVERARLPVGLSAPHVFVVHEVLGEIQPGVSARDAKDRQPRRPGPDRLDQPSIGNPARHVGQHPLGIAGERAPKDPERGVRPVLAQDEVSSEIGSAPALAERWCIRTCLVEQRAQSKALISGISHSMIVGHAAGRVLAVRRKAAVTSTVMARRR
jgi:hypothetical protein